MKEKDTMDPKTVIIIILLIIIANFIFDFAPALPEGCHLTPSVDVGGSEVECD